MLDHLSTRVFLDVWGGVVPRTGRQDIEGRLTMCVSELEVLRVDMAFRPTLQLQHTGARAVISVCM